MHIVEQNSNDTNFNSCSNVVERLELHWFSWHICKLLSCLAMLHLNCIIFVQVHKKVKSYIYMLASSMHQQVLRQLDCGTVVTHDDCTLPLSLTKFVKNVLKPHCLTSTWGCCNKLSFSTSLLQINTFNLGHKIDLTLVIEAKVTKSVMKTLYFSHRFKNNWGVSLNNHGFEPHQYLFYIFQTNKCWISRGRANVRDPRFIDFEEDQMSDIKQTKKIRK